MWYHRLLCKISEQLHVYTNGDLLHLGLGVVKEGYSILQLPPWLWNVTRYSIFQHVNCLGLYKMIDNCPPHILCGNLDRFNTHTSTHVTSKCRDISISGGLLSSQTKNLMFALSRGLAACFSVTKCIGYLGIIKVKDNIHIFATD